MSEFFQTNGQPVWGVHIPNLRELKIGYFPDCLKIPQSSISHSREHDLDFSWPFGRPATFLTVANEFSLKQIFVGPGCCRYRLPSQPSSIGFFFNLNTMSS